MQQAAVGTACRDAERSGIQFSAAVRGLLQNLDSSVRFRPAPLDKATSPLSDEDLASLFFALRPALNGAPGRQPVPASRYGCRCTGSAQRPLLDTITQDGVT